MVKIIIRQAIPRKKKIVINYELHRDAIIGYKIKILRYKIRYKIFISSILAHR